MHIGPTIVTGGGNIFFSNYELSDKLWDMEGEKLKTNVCQFNSL